MKPLPAPTKQISPWIKLPLDLGPLVVFFLTYKFADIFAATGALMVVSVITLGVTYFLTRKVAIIPLVTAALVLVFGGLTIWLNNDWFIKVKLTIIYVLLAAGLYAGLYMGRPFAKVMLEMALELPEWCWRTLTYRIAGFFLFIAATNEVVRQILTTDDWVTFKVIGVPLMMVLFMASNMPFIFRNEIKQPEDETPKPAA